MIKLEYHGQDDKQAQLSKKLRDAADAYYGNGTSDMTDREYDIMLEELAAMEKASGIIYNISPTNKVGAKVGSLKKVRHEQPALSLDKVKYKDRQDLVKWMNGNNVIVSWKMDGLTVILTYDNGKLVRAATRGDGEEGSDITHNAVNFIGVPKTIDYSGHLIVRGEAVMTYDEFKRVNAEAGDIYENPRNLAAATIQMLDPEESKKREIRFYAFTLVTPETDEGILYDGNGSVYDSGSEIDRILWLRTLGINTVETSADHKLFGGVAAPDNILDIIEEWKACVKDLQYPTDGLVISYVDAEYAASLGSTGHHPRGSIALKWTDETVTTTLRAVEWSEGKTGVITPVAVFDTIRLGAGSNVSRASLHNISVMRKVPACDETGNYGVAISGNGMKIGSRIEVGLANMIIPQVYAYHPGGHDLKEIDIPDKCPVCGETTYLEEKNGIMNLWCRNGRCPAKQVGCLMNTFCKDGLFVKGLGEAQLCDLINFGLIDRYPVTLYQMKEKTERSAEYAAKKEALLEENGWGQKSWDNLVSAIDASRKTTLQKFMYSLNVPLLGNDLSKKLSKHFDYDIEKFMRFIGSPDAVELMDLDGIGVEKAMNVYDWCIHTKNDATEWLMFRQLVEELRFEEAKPAQAQSLAGMTFVITGSVHDYKNRDEFKASVEARGGKVSGSVSKNTDYLINNDVESASGKNKKAKELGVKIISEDEFIAKFGK